MGGARTMNPSLRESGALDSFISVAAFILLGGALITEQIFVWPGVGQLAVNAIVNRDYPVLQGVILTVALLVTLVNLIVDTLYVVLDPRIRLS